MAYEQMTVEEYRQGLRSKRVVRAYITWNGKRLYVGRRVPIVGASRAMDTKDGIVTVPPDESIFVRWQEVLE